jgi:hypothetical protein
MSIVVVNSDYKIIKLEERRKANLFRINLSYRFELCYHDDYFWTIYCTLSIASKETLLSHRGHFVTSEIKCRSLKSWIEM